MNATGNRDWGPRGRQADHSDRLPIQLRSRSAVASGGVNEFYSKPEYHNKHKKEIIFQLNGCRCSMRMVPSRSTRCTTLLKVMLLLAMFFAPEFAAASNPRRRP